MSNNFNNFNDESDLDNKNIDMANKNNAPISNKEIEKKQDQENIYRKSEDDNKASSYLSVEFSDAFFGKITSRIK